jgi:hypothetical protein
VQINTLLKKKNALNLLAKVKKYEHEENTYRYSLAVQHEKIQKQKLAAISEQFSEIDAYLANNISMPYQKAIDNYSNYLSEMQKKELALNNNTKNEVLFFLEKRFKSNRIKKNTPPSANKVTIPPRPDKSHSSI